MPERSDDIEAFLARLVRLDREALVRVQSVPGRSVLWGRVPWNVLVSRTVAGPSRTDPAPADADIVVRASDWLAASAATRAADLIRADAGWRSPLPPDEREALETIPADVLRDLGAAAAGTLRAVDAGGVGGRAVGARAVRDALLDHVAIVVSAGSRRVEIPQRLVQAVVRMDFVAADQPIRVLGAGTWVGLAAEFGTAWWRPESRLTLTPSAHGSARRRFA